MRIVSHDQRLNLRKKASCPQAKLLYRLLRMPDIRRVTWWLEFATEEQYAHLESQGPHRRELGSAPPRELFVKSAITLGSVSLYFCLVGLPGRGGKQMTTSARPWPTAGRNKGRWRGWEEVVAVADLLLFS